MADSGALAERLQAGLARLEISQAELARRAGVTRAYVGRLLAGSQAAPTLEVIEALAAALEMGPVERLQLAAAAGVTLPEFAAALEQPTVARLLTALAVATPAERDELERLLTAALDLAGEPVVTRLLTTLAGLPGASRARLLAALAALLALVPEMPDDA